MLLLEDNSNVAYTRSNTCKILQQSFGKQITGNTATVPVTATDRPALTQSQHNGLLPVSH